MFHTLPEEPVLSSINPIISLTLVNTVYGTAHPKAIIVSVMIRHKNMVKVKSSGMGRNVLYFLPQEHKIFSKKAFYENKSQRRIYSKLRTEQFNSISI